MPAKLYTDEMLDFMQSNCDGRTNKQLAKLMTEKFGHEFSDTAVKSAMATHKIQRKVKGYPDHIPEHWAKLYPQEVEQYIRENHVGINQKRMAQIVNEKFGKNYSHSSMKYYYRKMGFKSGLTGFFSKDDPRVIKNRFKKGSHPSKKTEFKKGHRPINAVEVGTEVKNSDGWWVRKIAEPNVWKPIHRIVWEEAHGPIPDGKRIIFLDGDRNNYKLENLELISMRENVKLNHMKYRSQNAEATKLGLISIRLEEAVKEVKKK